VTAPTVAVATLGCRLNQVDSHVLATQLEARGLRTLPFGTPVDVVVVNTCTVTGRADVSDRQMIRRAVRRHPAARVVVTGCWAQTDPDAVAALPGVDVVVGNADKPRLPEIVARLLEEEAARGREPRGCDADIGGRVGAKPAPDKARRRNTPAAPAPASAPAATSSAPVSHAPG
jgi:threonylcarbamoyladenosine tRNA methylthiotransferase MtaB